MTKTMELLRINVKKKLELQGLNREYRSLLAIAYAEISNMVNNGPESTVESWKELAGMIKMSLDGED